MGSAFGRILGRSSGASSATKTAAARRPQEPTIGRQNFSVTQHRAHVYMYDVYRMLIDHAYIHSDLTCTCTRMLPT